MSPMPVRMTGFAMACDAIRQAPILLAYISITISAGQQVFRVRL
ncbi:hypothetical protein [Cupriavidus necator]